jgi:hypothetical protein
VSRVVVRNKSRLGPRGTKEEEEEKPNQPTKRSWSHPTGVLGGGGRRRRRKKKGRPCPTFPIRKNVYARYYPFFWLLLLSDVPFFYFFAQKEKKEMSREKFPKLITVDFFFFGHGGWSKIFK